MVFPPMKPELQILYESALLDIPARLRVTRYFDDIGPIKYYIGDDYELFVFYEQHMSDVDGIGRGYYRGCNICNRDMPMMYNTHHRVYEDELNAFISDQECHSCTLMDEDDEDISHCKVLDKQDVITWCVMYQMPRELFEESIPIL